jgi:formylglycine-generating enzyme required for sulfatase activity
MNQAQPAYNTAAVRRLLLAAFSDDEFTFFCYDHFSEVYQKFATGMTFPAKVQLLIDHCVRYSAFAELLPLVEEANPAKYAEFAASFQISQPQLPIPSLQSPVSPSLPRQPFEPEMILIPAGEFLMGSDPRVDPNAQDEEQPQYLVYLPNYYMAKTPVTNAQYWAFIQSTGHQPPQHWEKERLPANKDEHPVAYLNWHDAMVYCNWLAEVTGKSYRLPSEAEWEKGARGADGRIYPWGNQWEAKCCNTDEAGAGDTMPVGAYPEGASPYGLLDMAGNVWEWTRSLWGKERVKPNFKYPYRPGDGREDLKVGDKVLQVLRGGSFDHNRNFIRCASRGRDDPYLRGDYIGYRMVVSPI